MFRKKKAQMSEAMKWFLILFFSALFFIVVGSIVKTKVLPILFG